MNSGAPPFHGRAAPGAAQHGGVLPWRRGPRDPDKTGLILVHDADAPETAERFSFAELDEAVRRVAAGLLATGIRPGERLVIALPNTSDYLFLFFGALAAGIVPLPASSLLTAAEVGFLIADAEPAAVALPEGSDVAVPDGCPGARPRPTSPRSVRRPRSPPMPTPRPTTRPS